MCEAGKPYVLRHKMIKYVIQLLLPLLPVKCYVTSKPNMWRSVFSSLDVVFLFKKKQRGDKTMPLWRSMPRSVLHILSV